MNTPVITAFYVAIVYSQQHYGGAEEGGWYYSTRQVISERQLLFGTREEACRAKDFLQTVYKMGDRNTRSHSYHDAVIGYGKPVTDNLNHPHYE